MSPFLTVHSTHASREQLPIEHFWLRSYHLQREKRADEHNAHMAFLDKYLDDHGPETLVRDATLELTQHAGTQYVGI